ncbi:MAG: M3 family metallopeptidase [Deltaproteobacteria bacterium]|nr:M3 family metallopeptidase [Deltaproteobacteria bacterium]
MRRRRSIAFALTLCAASLAACRSPSPDIERRAGRGETGNPLLRPWAGPHGGTPPFGEVKLEHFEPALTQAMNDALAALQHIGRAQEPASFENTIAAMERAMLPFYRVEAVYGVWSGAKQTPEFQAIERKMAPELAAFEDRITQDEALFARLEAVYEGRDAAALTPEQKRLAWKVYRDFVRAGAKLDVEAKRRLTAINRELAGLFTRFGQNVLADESDLFLLLESDGDLAGLPAALRDAAAAEAEARKMPGKWVIRNTRSSIDPFLTYSERRDLRERAWRLFTDRGDRGGESDNNEIIARILALRAERAGLLGYPTHAHWRLENSMAKEPEAVLALLEQVWKPARVQVSRDVAAMQALADREGAGIAIQPWDYRFYAEKVRKQKYDLDESQLKPYLQLEQLREAMFWVAGQLFGYAFKPLEGVPVFHPDVRVFEVCDRSGRRVGLYFFDPWARSQKRSGAWMSAYRAQHRLDGEVRPIVSNNANFIKGKPGAPVLISWDDAQTLFHEFGHALHGLSSNVTYPSIAGTAVFRDYVEFPSQLLEHYLSTPEVLQRFARHHETGEPIPRELIERLTRAATFNQGFETVEYLASALVDMKLHLAGARPIDPDAFERQTLAALGMPAEIAMRHRTPHFLHVFAGDGYSAGYYSYLWADVISADAFDAFREAGGPYDPDLAARLLEHVLSVGNTIDPAEGYRRFRGRDARVDALMRERGFGEGDGG